MHVFVQFKIYLYRLSKCTKHLDFLGFILQNDNSEVNFHGNPPIKNIGFLADSIKKVFKKNIKVFEVEELRSRL